MARGESKEVKLEEEQERILTLKINLEGPAEVVSWIRESCPPRLRLGRRLMGLMPGEFRSHMRAAQREQLLAVRSLLDAMIRRTEREEQPPKRTVEVEVE